MHCGEDGQVVLLQMKASSHYLDLRLPGETMGSATPTQRSSGMLLKNSRVGRRSARLLCVRAVADQGKRAGNSPTPSLVASGVAFRGEVHRSAELQM